MPIAKRGSSARTSPFALLKAGVRSNTCFIRSGVTGTTMRAVIAKPSGLRRRPAIATPSGGFCSKVSSTSQVSSLPLMMIGTVLDPERGHDGGANRTMLGQRRFMVGAHRPQLVVELAPLAAVQVIGQLIEIAASLAHLRQDLA